MFHEYVNYFYIILYLFFVVIVGIVIFFVSYFFVIKNLDLENASTYECGFEPFSDVRNVFDVKFYLVAILFVIFDLEVLFVLPWTIVLYGLDVVGYCAMVLFLVVLALVFVYEWLMGALDWS